MRRGLLVAAGAALAASTLLAPRRAARVPVRDVRALALQLLGLYLPCEQGSAAFAEIAKDWGGLGTTCGYLPAWLLWRLGCREQLVNRDEPSSGLRYRIGKSISVLRWNSKFVRFQPGTHPKPGDIFFVSDGPPATEHVGVVVSTGTTWATADAGQGARAHQIARFVERRLEGKRLVRADGAPSRELQGWVDLDRVSFTAAPQLHGPAGDGNV